MRYLILSDMHGNADAFAAVLRRVRRKRFDAALVLGDLVGYGGGPNQVVEAVRRCPGEVCTVRGNHDKVVAGLEDGANFNHAALPAAKWTAERLTAANLRYVRELPQGPARGRATGVAICHGSPLDEDAYLFSAFDAFEIFTAHPARLTFFGHTHIPSLFVSRGPRHPGGAAARRRRHPAARARPALPAQPRARSASRATATRAPPT